MKNKFLDTVKKYSMFSPGDCVVVGLSGGADSMCLISLLYECKDVLDIAVSAVHVNHCIRGEEADRDEKFVRDFCAQKGIHLCVICENIPEISKITGESTELCARRIRYEAFAKCNADKIATAHSASDRIETFLFNLSRGSSLNGLCSIPAVRDNIVRPLIGFTRKEIEEYCHQNNISYVTDSSNLSDDYTRNKYRHNVIPELIQINPAFEKNAVRCMDILNDENEYLDRVVSEIFEKQIQSDGQLLLPDEIEQCLLRRLIVRYFDSMSLSYENTHISYICDNIGTKFAVVLPGKVKIESDGKYLCISERKHDERIPLETVSFNKCQGKIVVSNNRKIEVFVSDSLSEDNHCYCVDAGKISDTLTLRSRLPGDSIRTDKKRYTKPLKKIYNELKISPDDREYLYVLCDEQGVIFAENVGVDASRKCDAETEYFLTIKMESVNNE